MKENTVNLKTTAPPQFFVSKKIKAAAQPLLLIIKKAKTAAPPFLPFSKKIKAITPLRLFVSKKVKAAVLRPLCAILSTAAGCNKIPIVSFFRFI